MTSWIEDNHCNWHIKAYFNCGCGQITVEKVNFTQITIFAVCDNWQNEWKVCQRDDDIYSG